MPEPSSFSHQIYDPFIVSAFERSINKQWIANKPLTVQERRDLESPPPVVICLWFYNIGWWWDFTKFQPDDDPDPESPKGPYDDIDAALDEAQLTDPKARVLVNYLPPYRYSSRTLARYTSMLDF